MFVVKLLTLLSLFFIFIFIFLQYYLLKIIFIFLTLIKKVKFSKNKIEKIILLIFIQTHVCLKN